MDFARQVKQNAEEYQESVKDLLTWEKSVDSIKVVQTVNTCPVRAAPITSEKIKAYDYRSWDKFNVVFTLFI
jgi:hypothetical protein